MNTSYRKLLLVVLPVVVAGALIVGWTLSDSGTTQDTQSQAVTSQQSQPAPAPDAQGVESTGQSESATGSESAATGSATGSQSPSAGSSVPQQCNYAPGQSLNVSADQLVSFQDPKVGAADSPVTVIEFFDPNCSHCQAFHPVMKEVMSRYSDRVTFVMKPFPLWPYSVNQVEAMVLAGRQDQSKFYEMIDAQIERGVTDGLSDQQLIEIAEEIDLDVEQFAQALENDDARNRALYYAKMGEKFGISSTPTLVINGRVVAPASRTVECTSALIDDQLQQASTSSG